MIPAEARGAWRDIEARLRPYVARRVASAAEVDDIVQEILVKIHQGLGDPARRRALRRLGLPHRRATRSPTAARARARAPIADARTCRRRRRPRPRRRGGRSAAELGECVALFVARLPSPYREAITLTELAGPHPEGGGRDARRLALGDEVSRAARAREDPRDVRGVLRDLRGLPRPRRRMRGAGLADVPEDCRQAAVSWTARQGRIG